jgi:hypothetical protein
MLAIVVALVVSIPAAMASTLVVAVISAAVVTGDYSGGGTW